MAFDFKRIFYWFAVLAIWGLIFVVGFLAIFAIGLPDTSKIFDVQRQPTVTYLDRSGALIAVRGSQFAPPVEIDQLPPHVPAAFLAIEDRRFYHHPGFDPFGMARALVRNLRKEKGSNLAGGSTITQQLARNLFLSHDQTMKRKIQELILAVWLEMKFTKKQILALYLNRVYFGAGAYGIEAASQRYFNKQTSELTIGEAALLAGLMKGPSQYSPLSNQERAQRRANIVLNEMVEARVITEEQRAEAVRTPVRVTRTLATSHAMYFVDWLHSQVRTLVGEPVEDLIIETTLDLSIQTSAERAVQKIMERDVQKKVEQAALVAVDGEGRVRALIGGVNYAKSEFNRAIEAKRQAGSAFKPFVYLAAMEAGMTPSTMVVDEEYSIGEWTPRNYTNDYLGPVSLETALAKSLNTVAARVANDVGRVNVAGAAKRMGIVSRVGTDPSMALGAVEVNALEMAQSYTPFANGGFRATAHGITRIRTSKGKVLYQYREREDGKRLQVVSNPSLSHMNRMMRSVITSGTGTGVRIDGYDLAGKTGTTSDYRDAWFVGYTGGFVTAVWVGRDDNTVMRKVTGGGTPAAIWKMFMESTLPRLKVGAIPAGPVPLVPETTDPIGDLLNGGQANQGTEPGQAPGTMAPIPDPEPAPAEPAPVTPQVENSPMGVDFSDAA